MIILPAGVDLPNHPRIGWRNIIEPDMLSSDEAADGFPITNIANPATFLTWRGETDDAQDIVVTVGANATIDYLAIARHNLGTAGIAYDLESSDNGMDWDPVIDGNPDDDRVIIHEFDQVTASSYRLRLSAGSEAPLLAVVYLGQILTMERRIYVGHTPVPFALQRAVSGGRSESGQFLGRVRWREMVDFMIDMPNLTAAWTRSNLEAFIEASDITPFFWAWRPSAYPEEVAYVWTASEPATTNQRSNGMMEFTASVSGIR